MKKRFSLQRVLEINEREQNLREGELARVVTARMRKEEERMSIIQHQGETMEYLQGMQHGQMDFDHVMVTRAFIEGLQQDVEARTCELLNLELEETVARDSLLVARRKTKTLEKLRENEAERWKREESMAEVKRTDEISCIQFARVRNGVSTPDRGGRNGGAQR
jgi:flagellar export protein FliJ